MLIGEFILKIIYGMCFKVYNYYIKKIEIKSQQLYYNNRLGKGYFVKKIKELRINFD